MPSIAAEPVRREAEDAELQAVLQAHLFARSPALTRLLSYLCEKVFAGETEQIKEYSVAIDVFDRQDSFDPDVDSIVRVQANRLRKHLAKYYASEGAAHPLHITIPVGQYVPVFERMPGEVAVAEVPSSTTAQLPSAAVIKKGSRPWRKGLMLLVGNLALLGIVAAVVFVVHRNFVRQNASPPGQIPGAYSQQVPSETLVGLPAGEEVRILAGSTRKYVDHAGKLWNPDSYFSGGAAVPTSIPHIWRTQDPIIYRSSRQGEFTYNIPLKPGVYELHLHFAETFYGPENPGGGGEGSRVMAVRANGEPLLRDFDVLDDAGGERTADVKVFRDIAPAADGQLHLSFSSDNSGYGMLSAIEILPGIRGQARPVRIVARDVPYYSNDSHWWGPDSYFKGGQLSVSPHPVAGTDDPEFYETERWGHFSYAIPLPPGRYILTLHFIEHHTRVENSGRNAASEAGSNAAPAERVFNVFCNGKTILASLNIRGQAGEDRPLVRTLRGLEPNAQGKLLVDFVPVTGYATVTAIEVIPE